MPPRSRYKVMETNGGWHIYDKETGKRAKGTKVYPQGRKQEAVDLASQMNRALGL